MAPQPLSLQTREPEPLKSGSAHVYGAARTIHLQNRRIALSIGLSQDTTLRFVGVKR